MIVPFPLVFCWFVMTGSRPARNSQLRIPQKAPRISVELECQSSIPRIPLSLYVCLLNIIMLSAASNNLHFYFSINPWHKISAHNPGRSWKRAEIHCGPCHNIHKWFSISPTCVLVDNETLRNRARRFSPNPRRASKGSDMEMFS